MACNVSYDIIEKILLLLPIKSLIRFQLVCTQLRDLISSSTFVNTHLSSVRPVTQVHLFKRHNWCEPQITNPWSVSIPCIDSKLSEIDIVEIDNPVTDPIRSVIGSCNGLLLVATTNQVFLWNPSIRERVNFFCEDHIWNILERRDGNILFGLCYNSVFDEYKVIYVNNCYHTERNIVLIFSCRIGYWKRVACDFPCTIRERSRGVTLNGCPHWIIRYEKHFVRDYDDDDDTRFTRLVYFDTMNDNFKSLSIPIGWVDYSPNLWHDRLPDLSLLGGCLCATKTDYSNNSSEVWVMNEFGVEDSWTKLCVIPHSLIIKGPMIRPFGFVNNGEEVVLVDDGGNIVTCNFRTNEQKNNSRDCMMKFLHSEYHLIEYSESLVSLRRFDKRDRRRIKQSEKLFWAGSGFKFSKN